jgi:hypothetical protein
MLSQKYTFLTSAKFQSNSIIALMDRSEGGQMDLLAEFSNTCDEMATQRHKFIADALQWLITLPMLPKSSTLSPQSLFLDIRRLQWI